MKKLRDFSCDKCTHKFESFVEDSQVMLACIKCGSEAYRRLSAPKCFQNTVGKSPSVKGQIVKIVKFKDGKYGVRRFNWSYLCFEFLCPQFQCWFTFQGNILKYCHLESVEKCHTVFSAFKDIEARKKEDIGKPITKGQIVSILKELKDERIVEFEAIESGGFVVTEMCDRYFYCKISKDELLQLADELIELANKQYCINEKQMIEGYYEQSIKQIRQS